MKSCAIAYKLPVVSRYGRAQLRTCCFKIACCFTIPVNSMIKNRESICYIVCISYRDDVTRLYAPVSDRFEPHGSIFFELNEPSVNQLRVRSDILVFCTIQQWIINYLIAVYCRAGVFGDNHSDVIL